MEYTELAQSPGRGGRGMNGCVYRTADNQCQKYSDPIRNTMSWCVGNEPCEGRTPSIADRIRTMTDEELAETLYWLRLDALRFEGFEGQIETTDEILDWLKSPVEVDNG